MGKNIIKQKKKKRLNKKIFIFLIPFIIIITVSIILIMYFLNSDNKTTNKETTNNNIVDLVSNGSADDARELVNKKIKENDNIENRRDLAYIEVAEENYKEVINIYSSNSINEKDLNYIDYQNIAMSYEKTGDKTNAAENYRKAAELWPKDDPSYESEVEYLNRQADALEGKIDV